MDPDEFLMVPIVTGTSIREPTVGKEVRQVGPAVDRRVIKFVHMEDTGDGIELPAQVDRSMDSPMNRFCR